MEPYELEPDKILNWALEYASYKELEETAKSLYSIYISRRKKERPDEQKKAKQYRKQFSKRRQGK